LLFFINAENSSAKQVPIDATRVLEQLDKSLNELNVAFSIANLKLDPI
jgi:hypothetical protein